MGIWKRFRNWADGGQEPESFPPVEILQPTPEPSIAPVEPVVTSKPKPKVVKKATKKVAKKVSKKKK